MTTQTPKKMHLSATSAPQIALAWAAGAAEALLLARLLLRLLAARPDNPAFALLYAITGPLVAPLAPLDRGQPLFGASLEISTLIMAIAVPTVAYVAWIWLGRRATRGAAPAS